MKTLLVSHVTMAERDDVRPPIPAAVPIASPRSSRFPPQEPWRQRYAQDSDKAEAAPSATASALR